MTIERDGFEIGCRPIRDPQFARGFVFSEFSN
jgi:hypothetical protein